MGFRVYGIGQHTEIEGDESTPNDCACGGDVNCTPLLAPMPVTLANGLVCGGDTNGEHEPALARLTLASPAAPSQLPDRADSKLADLVINAPPRTLACAATAAAANCSPIA